VSGPVKPILFLPACICGAGSVLLFVFKTILDIALPAAIALAVTALVCIYGAFFPHHLIRTQRRIEEEVGKEQSTHLGRWVP